MAIYDGNGNVIQQSVAYESPKYDYWTQVPNYNGGVGFMPHTRVVDSTGEVVYDAWKTTSGYIPCVWGLKAKISDPSKITSANLTVCYVNSSYQKVFKSGVSWDENGEFSISPQQGSTYMLFSCQCSSTDFTIMPVKPQQQYLVSNKYAEGFLKNVSYPSDDYTYSAFRKYVQSGLNDINNLRQPKRVWCDIPYSSGCTNYVLTLSEASDYSSPLTYNIGYYTPYYAVANLKTDTFYYAKITATKNAETVTVGEYQFTTEGSVRMIIANGVSNGRDIGGKKTERWGKVKQGLVFRSAMLEGAGETGVAELEKLGIVAEVDLRGDSEIDDYVSLFQYYVKANMGSSQGLAQGNYEAFSSCFSKIVTLLKNERPLIYHCKGGADRTGVLSAILEGVLGVSESDINKDYELTALHNNSTYRDDLEDAGHWFSEGQIAMQSVEGATLADKYANILIAGGASAQDIEDFRCIMLTDYNAEPIAEE